MTAPLLSLPTSACFAEVTPEMRVVVGGTASPFTLEDQDFKWPGEKFAFSLTMPPFTQREIAEEWIAFGIKMKGRYGRVLMGDPTRKTPRGVATGTPLVDGLQQAGAETLLTKGWTPNTPNILKRGDAFQLGSGVTAYYNQLTENADSDADGKAVLSLATALRTSYNDNAAIVVQNPVGRFKLTSNSWSWRASPGGIYRLSFDVEEALP